MWYWTKSQTTCVAGHGGDSAGVSSIKAQTVRLTLERHTHTTDCTASELVSYVESPGPGCRRCRWHWRKALQVGLRTGHSAPQCRGRPLHWPALGTAVPANGPALGTHQCPVPAIERKRALECRPKVCQVPLFRSKKALNRARKPAKSDLMLEKARPDFSDNICVHFFS